MLELGTHTQRSLTNMNKSPPPSLSHSSDGRTLYNNTVTAIQSIKMEMRCPIWDRDFNADTSESPLAPPRCWIGTPTGMTRVAGQRTMRALTESIPGGEGNGGKEDDGAVEIQKNATNP